MIYLDNNASTQILPEIRTEISEFLFSNYGNPSSPHSYGTYARRVIEESRNNIADALKTDPYHIIFTSSGSESNNMILKTILNLNPMPNLIISSIEHSSIRKTCEFLISKGVKILIVPVNNDGLLDLEILKNYLKKGPSFVSLQWVNNETGVIQPMEDIAKLCHSYNAVIHTDAAQAYGKIVVNINEIDLDFISFTGHKIHALQGVGAVYAKNMKSLTRMIHSGYEEYELRGGTENVLGILSFGKASEIRFQEFDKKIIFMKKMRDDFERMLCRQFPELHINGIVDSRVCNTTNLLFPGIDGRALMAQFDREGLICSQTSACTTQIPEPSHVLLAMGLNIDDAFSSLRFSFSVLNTDEDVINAVGIVSKVYNRLKAMKDFF